jgi:hypothetical protein
VRRIAQRDLLNLAHQRHVIADQEIIDRLALSHGAAEVRDRNPWGDPTRLDHRSREGAHEASSRNRTNSSLASDARRGDCVPVIGDHNQGNDAFVQEIDLFDFITGQMQELALPDGDDLQMGLKQRIIPRSQRRQETIASMLVLIWIQVGLTPPSAPTIWPSWVGGISATQGSVCASSAAAKAYDARLGIFMLEKGELV